MVAIVQARMGSSRLPGKVLDTIDGVPMLGRVVERVQAATSVQSVVVATSREAADRAIVEYCQQRLPGVAVTAFGPEQDVLSRFIVAASKAPFRPSAVVRITADCPMVDPALIDQVVATFARGCDYASNVWPVRTFPDGLDVEVISIDRLLTMSRCATAREDREHVTTFLHRYPYRAGVMRSVRHTEDLSAVRWTVDTADDLEFVRSVYRRFAPRRVFSWREVLADPTCASRRVA